MIMDYEMIVNLLQGPPGPKCGVIYLPQHRTLKSARQDRKNTYPLALGGQLHATDRQLKNGIFS